jgi:hypothetical protein
MVYTSLPETIALTWLQLALLVKLDLMEAAILTEWLVMEDQTFSELKSSQKE